MEQFLVYNECLPWAIECREHTGSTMKYRDAVGIALECLFIRTQGFTVAPGLLEHLCFVEHLLDRHLFPVKSARRGQAYRR